MYFWSMQIYALWSMYVSIIYLIYVCINHLFFSSFSICPFVRSFSDYLLFFFSPPPPPPHPTPPHPTPPLPPLSLSLWLSNYLSVSISLSLCVFDTSANIIIPWWTIRITGNPFTNIDELQSQHGEAIITSIMKFGIKLLIYQLYWACDYSSMLD